MPSPDIWLVIGTRPEAIKLKPVAKALTERGINPRLIITGQHPSLDPQEFGIDGFEQVHLGCPGQEDPHRHVQSVTKAMAAIMRETPDLLIVQGDTSSALGGALAGFAMGIPVAHVEAGLRTHDPLLPWPEEEYRTAIDAGADLLFAPTELSAANLRAEQVPGEIHVTGNTGIDALLELADRLPPRKGKNRTRKILVTCHRRESWGEGLASIAAALLELGADGATIEFILHPNPHVAGNMRRHLSGAPGVNLLKPCGHLELLERMLGADLVLSDSGGIQEEAPALGVPLLVLRQKTERPEGIAAGTSRLVGTGKDRIIAKARRLLDDPTERAVMGRRAFPFGDGKAAPRIARIIEDWLEERSLTRRLA